ncbi:endochitinase-like [Dermacentor andersoni]|uniref:endochitinase-like n=1 Tax=Dermacentor andersoni TaxID=34620 RepID=UPI003B3B78F2
MESGERTRAAGSTETAEWVEKLPRVLSRRRIPIFIFAFIGVLTVAGACFAAVTAVVLYRTAVHELSGEEEADGPIALSGPLPNGMPSRLRPAADARRVFCIYNNRVSERQPLVNFSIEDLKVHFCDDIVYGFVGLDGTSTNIRSKHPKYDFLEEGLKRFVGLKRSKPEVNLWACLGGSVDDGPRFVALVKERRTRVTFVRNSAEWLRRNAFQGLLIYWKYPSHEHRVNFTVLLADLRNSYARDGLLVSVVLPINTRLRRDSYYVQSVYENLDVVLVDGHRSVDPRHFPLATCATPVRTLLRTWHQGQYGLMRVLDDLTLETDDYRKTVLSVSFAGLSFTLRHRSLHRVGAAAAGPGAPGARTNESGLLSYVEVQERLRNEGWKRAYHRYGHCPFARKELQWVAYEDEESVADKAVLTSVCAGLAVWDADMDDFAGVLGKPCPLLRKVHEVVHASASKRKNPGPPRSYRKFF